MWRFVAWARLIDPLPLAMNRFAAAFLVFIFGITTPFVASAGEKQSF
jgi:hypothetical protein